MIHAVSGDILLSGADAIAHGIAPNDHFDNGLALALRERWPAMAKDFRHYAHQSHPGPGDVWFWGGADGARIYCLLTQAGDIEHGARPGKASLPNVNHCLRHLRQQLEQAEICSVALPRLATGVGGLRWEEVRPLIEQQLGDLSLRVYLYEHYVPGQRANEPDLQ